MGPQELGRAHDGRSLAPYHDVFLAWDIKAACATPIVAARIASAMGNLAARGRFAAQRYAGFMAGWHRKFAAKQPKDKLPQQKRSPKRWPRP